MSHHRDHLDHFEMQGRDQFRLCHHAKTKLFVQTARNSYNFRPLDMATRTFAHVANTKKGIKRSAFESVQSQQPQKKTKVLLEEDDLSDQELYSAGIPGAAPPNNGSSFSNDHGFTINESFARRFEHNKKREEIQKRKSWFPVLYKSYVLTYTVEEKYGKISSLTGQAYGAHLEEGDSVGAESSSDSEEEDDEGILASGHLDAQIQSTLEAIRRKDPRVYDEKARFYTESEEEAQYGSSANDKKEKPMYLNDYHRKKLLDGGTTDDPTNVEPTYAQQQDNLKSVIVKEMHAAANDEDGSKDDRSDDPESEYGFLIKKSSAVQDDVRPTQAGQGQQELNIEAADKDPETYLSNFMSARAWVPSDGSRFQPFESDDEEEERRAERFEEAYNLRFEDPSTSNEKLLSHARDAAAKYSVRKGAINPRKKAREAERVKKEIAQQTREEEKARLRKLKVAEAEAKIEKIKEAAGLRGESLQEEDWSTFLEENWDDRRWEQEMRKRFGDDYYAAKDMNANDKEESKGKRKTKKPRWEDDIEIGDLIPDFNAEENGKPTFELTEDESDPSRAPEDEGSNVEPTTKRKANKKRNNEEQRKAARKERRKIERLVDRQIDVDETLSKFRAGQFRYRDTSPIAYGLTAQDILMASDSQLNQYAGLKKLAAFRDSDKKKRDKKHLGKKARLRQWRKDAFGTEQGPQKTLTEVLSGQDLASSEHTGRVAESADVREAKKKTRSRKSKALKSS